MIALLLLVVWGEGLVAFLLMVKIGPLRELVMKGLDQLKMRRATVLAIAATISVILLSDLFSILKIQNKGSKHSTMTPMDEVIWRTILLEATLMGFSLLLWFLIDRMDHYKRKLMKLRSSVERLEREMKEREDRANVLQKEISGLREDLKRVKKETAEKDDQVLIAEAYVVALQKQAADLLLEYDRLSEDNQNLQNQLYGFHT